MRRYRPLVHDFDLRAHQLRQAIKEDWAPEVKESWEHSKAQVREGLIHQYGAADYARKAKDFEVHGVVPLSVVAHHNAAFRQIRDSFVVGAYYPALTAATSLGERILNHLIFGLRERYANTRRYKGVARKNSLQNWHQAINVLREWDVLREEVVPPLRRLEELRQKAVHFLDPELIQGAREHAGEAMELMREIIELQFGSFGPHPWFITDIPGVVFVKKSWEDHPFVQLVYVPNCVLVGPNHFLETGQRPGEFKVIDDPDYEDRDITDEEFSKLYIAANEKRVAARTA